MPISTESGRHGKQGQTATSYRRESGAGRPAREKHRADARIRHRVQQFRIASRISAIEYKLAAIERAAGRGWPFRARLRPDGVFFPLFMVRETCIDELAALRPGSRSTGSSALKPDWPGSKTSVVRRMRRHTTDGHAPAVLKGRLATRQQEGLAEGEAIVEGTRRGIARHFLFDLLHRGQSSRSQC